MDWIPTHMPFYIYVICKEDTMAQFQGLTCEQLQAMRDEGDRQIEEMYIASRTNPSDPLSGAPRLSIYALTHSNTIDATNQTWMNIYNAQLAWKRLYNLILQQQRTQGCFQII